MESSKKTESQTQSKLVSSQVTYGEDPLNTVFKEQSHFSSNKQLTHLFI